MPKWTGKVWTSRSCKYGRPFDRGTSEFRSALTALLLQALKTYIGINALMISKYIKRPKMLEPKAYGALDPL